jgi:signal transduction histidine kinase
MGLALCKKIVEHHGGTIRIDTSYTDGTRFEFTLPIAVDTQQHQDTLEGARR